MVSSPTFWAGTNSGSVFIYTLVLPLADNRKDEDIHASLSKEIQLRHHAPVVHISVVDAHGTPMSEKTATKDSGGDGGHVQKVIICSEEQFKVSPPLGREFFSFPLNGWHILFLKNSLSPRSLRIFFVFFQVFYLPSLKPFTKYKLTAHEGSLLRKVRVVKFASKQGKI